MVRISDHDLIARLETVVGHVLDQPDLLAEWTRDFWPVVTDLNLDDLPVAAVLPDTADEISAVVSLAAECERAVLTKGGGSSVVGAIEPIPGAIVIDTRGLNVIDAVDEVDHTVRVDAGVYGGEFEERLNELGYTLGFFPRSMHISTVGGWICSGASGVLDSGAGDIEAILLGVELILADGRVVWTGTAPRYAAGPRWQDLIVGSEGRLAIVSAATFAVRPMPEERRFLAVAVESRAKGHLAMRRLAQRGCAPALLRLFDPVETAELAEGFERAADGCALIVMIEGEAASVAYDANLISAALTSDGCVEFDSAIASRWFDARTDLDWLMLANEADGALAGVIDLAAPWSAIDAVADAVMVALRPIVDRVSVSTYRPNRQGAALDVSVFVQAADDDEGVERYQAAWAAAIEATEGAGGWRGHHGGTGQARRVRRDPAVESIALGIRRAFDPAGRLNPRLVER